MKHPTFLISPKNRQGKLEATTCHHHSFGNVRKLQIWKLLLKDIDSLGERYMPICPVLVSLVTRNLKNNIRKFERRKRCQSKIISPIKHLTISHHSTKEPIHLNPKELDHFSIIFASPWGRLDLLSFS